MRPKGSSSAEDNVRAASTSAHSEKMSGPRAASYQNTAVDLAGRKNAVFEASGLSGLQRAGQQPLEAQWEKSVRHRRNHVQPFNFYVQEEAAIHRQDGADGQRGSGSKNRRGPGQREIEKHSAGVHPVGRGVEPRLRKLRRPQRKQPRILGERRRRGQKNQREPQRPPRGYFSRLT